MTNPQARHVLDFVQTIHYGDLPEHVVAQARRCLLDLCGVAAAGTATRLSAIVRDYAAENFGATRHAARLFFDGRRVSLPGAALAGASTIDSMDAHDGHVLTKGHVGVTVFPVALALADDGLIETPEAFLTSLVLGYEIATRAGIALHATACDYHTSGAWNALAAAALTARALGLEAGALREAIGTAEYFGPRSQMMRCIDHPTMVKDGSGWGALGGVSAALLAAQGFTGAPAVTVEDETVAAVWHDLGSHWAIMDQYFKPYPVCRWAQPAVEAVLTLSRAESFRPEDIERVTIASFHEACQLASRHPASTEEAQYSLPFPVAIALARGQLGAEEVTGAALADELANRLADRIVLEEDPGYSGRFPAERWAHASIHLRDGRVLRSTPHTARGDAEAPLSGDELKEKFFRLTTPVLGEERARDIYDTTRSFGGNRADLTRLRELLMAPADFTASAAHPSAA